MKYSLALSYHKQCASRVSPLRSKNVLINGKQDRKRFLVFLVEVEKQQQSHCLISSESLLVCAVSPDLSAMCFKNNILSFSSKFDRQRRLHFTNFNIFDVEILFLPFLPSIMSTLLFDPSKSINTERWDYS